MNTADDRGNMPTVTGQQDIALPGSDQLPGSPKDSAAPREAGGSVSRGPFSKSPVSGSSLKQDTRSSEQGEKYNTDVPVSRAAMPAGLARVLDILAKSVQPMQVTPDSSKPKADH